MDLSLALGLPSELLSRVMTEREFRRWGMYRRKNLLPWQKMEIYMAQLTRMIAVTMGGLKDAKIADYMIEFQPPADAEPANAEQYVPTAEEAQQIFGFNPRKRKEQ